MKQFLTCVLLLSGLITVHGQLVVTAYPPKVGGQKALVPLVIRNGFAEKIESARAECFILDDHGKMLAQSSRWIIGGTKDKAGLMAGATNTFNFVVPASKPFLSTNLTAKISFSRVVLEGGKLVDARQVTVTRAEK